MSNAETIKDFLVSLGFELDEAGEKKFSAVIAGVTANVLKMGAVVEGAALSVVGFTTKIASGLDKVYFASQRTGASVAGIKALGYAASQLGVDAASAQGSLESLARFIRNSPGAEGFLNRLGIQTRSANGNMRDTSAKQSNRFMTSMRNLTMTLGQARDKIGANLANGLAGDIDSLRKQLLDNWPKIEAMLMKVIKGVLWAGDAVTRVLWRTGQAVGDVINWFKKLDPITQQLIMLFGGLLVAWRLLNTAFLTSPVGIVLSLGAAIFALYDDYKTWKEGGNSLIDWGQWEQEINAALKGMDDLTKSIKGVGVEIARLLNINLKNWTLKGDIENLTKQFGEFGKMLSMIGDLINALKEGNWVEVARIGKALLSQGSDQPDAMPAVTDSANSAADWVKDKTGFDPRSVGRWLRGEGDATDPRGIRNNNPGNINYVGQDGASLERPGGRFAKFDTAYDGLKAMARQLMRYFTGKTTGKPLQTLTDIISTWAPGSENNTGAYIAQLSKMLNVHPDAVLNLENPQVMSALMGGIIHHENGRNPYSSELINRAAGGMQPQGLQQETNINIYDATDPVAVGSEIAGRQTNVNARLTQQLNTSTR